jgi:hypothetical protein
MFFPFLIRNRCLQNRCLRSLMRLGHIARCINIIIVLEDTFTVIVYHQIAVTIL